MAWNATVSLHVVSHFQALRSERAIECHCCLAYAFAVCLFRLSHFSRAFSSTDKPRAPSPPPLLTRCCDGMIWEKTSRRLLAMDHCRAFRCVVGSFWRHVEHWDAVGWVSRRHLPRLSTDCSSIWLLMGFYACVSGSQCTVGSAFPCCCVTQARWRCKRPVECKKIENGMRKSH